jgi:hypothetical protein
MRLFALSTKELTNWHPAKARWVMFRHPAKARWVMFRHPAKARWATFWHPLSGTVAESGRTY